MSKLVFFRHMVIDNFDKIRKHLDFIDTKLDRYIVHILRRTKDISQGFKNALGANEAQRLIKTYYIDSLEYFDRKREAIKELCRANNARAYINVQPKDNFECLLNLGEKIFETIRNKNYSVKPEHLVRQAFCEWHKTRKKQWIIDLDNDEMTEYFSDKNGCPNGYKVWTKKEVMALVQKELEACGKDPTLAYSIPTKNGVHIITPPFNLLSAAKKCGMLFEGCKKIPIELHWTGLETYEIKHKQVTGWLHKDGMTLLFYENNG